jgi:hypothetical protein
MTLMKSSDWRPLPQIAAMDGLLLNPSSSGCQEASITKLIGVIQGAYG